MPGGRPPDLPDHAPSGASRSCPTRAVRGASAVATGTWQLAIGTPCGATFGDARRRKAWLPRRRSPSRPEAEPGYPDLTGQAGWSVGGARSRSCASSSASIATSAIASLSPSRSLNSRYPGRSSRAPPPAPGVACPNCGVLLDPPPTSTRLCPRCRRRIVVRRSEGPDDLPDRSVGRGLRGRAPQGCRCRGLDPAAAVVAPAGPARGRSGRSTQPPGRGAPERGGRPVGPDALPVHRGSGGQGGSSRQELGGCHPDPAPPGRGAVRGGRQRPAARRGDRRALSRGARRRPSGDCRRLLARRSWWEPPAVPPAGPTTSGSSRSPTSSGPRACPTPAARRACVPATGGRPCASRLRPGAARAPSPQRRPARSIRLRRPNRARPRSPRMNPVDEVSIAPLDSPGTSRIAGNERDEYPARVDPETRWLVETGTAAVVNGPGSLRTERRGSGPVQ